MRICKRYPQKTIAWALALFFLLVLLFSSAVMVSAIGHHCIGEQCEICFHVHLLSALLRQLTWLWGLSAVIVSLPLVAKMRQTIPALAVIGFTPVRLRVRMNN